MPSAYFWEAEQGTSLYDPGRLTWAAKRDTSRNLNQNIPRGKVAVQQYNGTDPVRLGRWTNGDVYWLYLKRVYVTKDPDLEPDDVRALVNEAGNRRRIQLDKAHALQAMADGLESAKREGRVPLSQEVKLEVWRRDGGRCVECGSQEKLEFDHIIPVAMGGSNTARNIQLLCETCNRRKGATLG